MPPVFCFAAARLILRMLPEGAQLGEAGWRVSMATYIQKALWTLNMYTVLVFRAYLA